MKPRVYAIIILLVVPVQASLLSPLTVFGVAPDLALAVVYAIGLLTSPREAAFAGIALGLVQDIHAGGLLGLTGFTRGVVGLLAGLLGRRVLNVASMSNVLFLAAFSLAEGILISLFMQIYYGDVPFFSVLFARLLPRALYTGLLGALLLRFVNGRKVQEVIMRRGFEREVI